MKIKQLDYTSMYNANRIALAARQTNTANTRSTFGRQNAEMARSIYAKQSSATKLQTGAEFVNSILDLGMNIVKTKQIFDKAKAAEESTEANNAYSSIMYDLEDKKADLIAQGKSLIGEDGKSPSAEYQALLDEAQGRIQGLEFSGYTKKAMEDSFNQYKSASWQADMSDSLDAKYKNISDNRNRELERGIEAAIRSGDSSGVMATIDSWKDLSEDARELVRKNAQDAIDSGSIWQNARLVTDSNGYNDGQRYLKEQYDAGNITLDEYDQYNSQLYTRHANNLKMTQQNVVDTFSEEMQTTGSPVTARDRAMAIVDNAPEEDRDILRAALDQAQLGVFNQNNQWLNGLEYMDNDEIQKRLDEVKADEAGYFHGMDGADGSNDLKSPVMKGLELQMEKNKATEAEAQSKEYKAQKEALRNDIDYAMSEFSAGRTNASSAISSMYGALEKATLLKDTSEGRNIVLTAINKMTDTVIPSWYRDQFKARVNDTIKNLDDLEKYGVDQLDLQAGIEAKVLDFLRDYGNNEWGKSEIDSFLDGFGKEEAGKALEALSTTPDIKWGGGYSTDTADLKSYIKVLNAMASGQMYYTESAGNTIDGAPNMGKVKGITAKAQDQWDKTSSIGEWTINQVFGDGFVNSVEARPMTTLTEDGSVLTTQYYPTYFGQDGKLYSVMPNEATGGLRIVTRSEDGTTWSVSKEIDRNGVCDGVSILTRNTSTTRSTQSAYEKGYYGATGSKATYDQAAAYGKEVNRLVSDGVPIQVARYQAWYKNNPPQPKMRNENTGPDVKVPELSKEEADQIVNTYERTGGGPYSIVKDLMERGMSEDDAWLRVFGNRRPK